METLLPGWLWGLCGADDCRWKEGNSDATVIKTGALRWHRRLEITKFLARLQLSNNPAGPQSYSGRARPTLFIEGRVVIEVQRL